MFWVAGKTVLKCITQLKADVTRGTGYRFQASGCKTYCSFLFVCDIILALPFPPGYGCQNELIPYPIRDDLHNRSKCFLLLTGNISPKWSQIAGAPVP